MRRQGAEGFPYYLGVTSLGEIATRDDRVCVLNILGNESRDVTPVGHAFSGGNVKFSVQTPDLGEAQDELTVTYEGEPLEIGFNAMYLLEILKYMPTDEVRFTFKAPERAATIEPVGWNDPASYMALVMPLRLVD